MGSILGQCDESGSKERAIYYLSKKFTHYERRYSAFFGDAVTLPLKGINYIGSIWTSSSLLMLVNRTWRAR